MGLHRAFPKAKIIGIDTKPQPNYPFEFIQMHWLDGAEEYRKLADFFWASPTCQGHSKTRAILRGKGLVNPGDNNQIPRVRNWLKDNAGDRPWVIENVPGAPLIHPLMLCGTMFGLGVLRHRYFETSFSWLSPHHPVHDGGTNSHRGYSVGAKYVTVGGNNYRRIEGAKAMGIDWMLRREELNQAIPPAYSEYIARQYQARRGGPDG